MKFTVLLSRAAVITAIALVSGVTHADQLTPAQISSLGTSLTPVGADPKGNESKTIPPWTGGLPTNAAPISNNYVSNPFPDDKPLFVITAGNYREHLDKLTPGQVAMFTRYPETFKMPIYTSRRSVGFPDSVYKEVRETAGQARTVNGGDGITNFDFKYFAFPIPSTGAEALWNHKTRYRINLQRSYANATPTSNGDYNTVHVEESLAYPQFVKDADLEKLKGIFTFLQQRTISPARYAGNVLLVHDTLDPTALPRLAWTYSAGQRRVRRAPQVVYDSPDTNADGMRTVDNFFLFSGAPDLYNWKLVGKKEIYVPYNSYKLADPNIKYADILKPGHINSDLTRYELHRVWEVDGTLKEGARHIYAKRNLFIDEDSWMILTADHYDGRGNLWRVGEGHLLQQYHRQIPSYAVETLYDLIAGRYTAAGMYNNEGSGPNFNYNPSYNDFTPSALRSAGIR
ncbi:DUF1329 domain-containing protein [Pseudomonas vancouverensis]|uniref:DUF1329 domain-containing protein n=1 Tax=Pseudomonas vancouverensis TaxID=95300 RepID=UPI003D02C74C